MAIKFFNIRSKEVVIADSEPKIAALWASSDRSPNITQGQDFGWRLAPEVVVQMRKIAGDFAKMQEIAVRYQLSSEDVGEKEILKYIADTTREEEAPVGDENDYSDEYQDEIRRLQNAEKEAGEAKTTTTTTTAAPTTTTTTTKSK